MFKLLSHKYLLAFYWKMKEALDEFADDKILDKQTLL